MKGSKGLQGNQSGKVHFVTRDEYKVYTQRLLDIRDQLLDEIQFHAADNLKRTSQDATNDLSAYKFHMADGASDNFDREFSLTMVSNRQEVLYEIDDALERIENGTYGVCEMSGKPIARERLDVIPWARFTAVCQEEFERKNKKHIQTFIPQEEFKEIVEDEEKVPEEATQERN